MIYSRLTLFWAALALWSAVRPRAASGRGGPERLRTGLAGRQRRAWQCPASERVAGERANDVSVLQNMRVIHHSGGQVRVNPGSAHESQTGDKHALNSSSL
jgi:hypothetical protein